MSLQSFLFVVYMAVGLLIALLAHELAHGWLAVRLGDQSPRMMRRLTLDPRAHLDPFGSLLLPGILLLPVLFGQPLFPVFAYAKPMPVNPWNLRRRERDAVLIALAGPAANVVLAFAFGALFRLAANGPVQPALFVAANLQVNVVMAVMQLVPIPSLDGSRVLARFLPARAREVYTGLDPYAALFILVVFFIIPGPVGAFVRVVGNGVCGLVAGGACIG